MVVFVVLVPPVTSDRRSKVVLVLFMWERGSGVDFVLLTWDSGSRVDLVDLVWEGMLVPLLWPLRSAKGDKVVLVVLVEGSMVAVEGSMAMCWSRAEEGALTRLK